MLKKPIVFCGLLIFFSSCTKVDIVFEQNELYQDPAITFLDNYTLEISTYKLDSFATSGGTVMTIGQHNDPQFGQLSSGSFVEVTVPADNGVKGMTVELDSVVMFITPTGDVYGDTATTLHLGVFKMKENLEVDVEETSSIYYPRSYDYESLAMSVYQLPDIRPNRKREISLRLPDSLGQSWLEGLRKGWDEFTIQSKFRQYFKGIYVGDNSGNNKAVFVFGINSTRFIRIYYKERGVTAVSKTIDFGAVTATQFSSFKFDYSGTYFTAFRPFKRELFESKAMGNMAFISNNMPSYMQVKIPGVFSIKELSTYYKVIKAELLIKPYDGTYSYPYVLPEQLDIFVSNSNYDLISPLYDSYGNTQTGNLAQNSTSGKEFKYSFDVTRFINDVLAEGQFSNKSLMIGVNAANNYASFGRLVIGDQSVSDNIKLKLYVLSL